MASEGLNNSLFLTSIAVLPREIEAIFQEAVGNFPPREIIEDEVETLIRAGRRGDVPQAADRLISLLSLNLDDLRKAALLSLMARLTGKRKFDPVAAYVLEKRATYVTSQG
jgi:hypothetical protein